jgi:PAS domain S-box-containing protein
MIGDASPVPPSVLRRYGLAAACAVVALAVRAALTPVLGSTLPFITLFAAVAIAVWYGGYGPALITTILGYLGANLLFISPGGVVLVGMPELVGLLGYFATSGVIMLFGEQMRRARRQAETSAADAAQQREWFRTTLASIGDAVIATDTQGRVTFLNGVAEALTGWKMADAAGQPLDLIFRIHNEQSREPAENPAARALREGAAIGLANHTILVARDGTERPIDDSAAPIKDSAGVVSGVVLVFRDITQRRRLELLQRDQQGELERQVRERTADLERSREVFRLLIEGGRDYAIYMLDPDGRVVSWNPGAEAIKGYREDEIIGQHFSRFYLPEDVRDRKPERELEAARRTGKYSEEDWRVRKDGTRFWASVLITALFDPGGTLRGFSKVTRDRTEQKEAEDQARRLSAERAAREQSERTAELVQGQREQLRVTLESIGDAVIATDLRGHITLLNGVAQRLTGWSGPEAVGKPLAAVFIIRNEHSGLPVENPVVRVLREGKTVGLANHTVLVARDGSTVPIDDSAAPILDREGQVAGVVMVFREVTERRRLESELQARLEELAEAERKKDEFLAILAHELRNPLAPLRNAVLLLQRSENPVANREVLALMERQLVHLIRLVSDLLDVSRISRGALALRRKPVELAAVVASALETSRPLIERRGHQLSVTLPADPLWVDADLIRMSQVLVNLLNNAAKYTESGGLIRLTVIREGSDAVVSVADTGIGIRPELLPAIFEMFTQVDRSLERSQGGLGIGLSLAKRLVHLHGGSIEARSEGPGRGSEFVVRLPVRLAGAGTGGPEERPAVRVAARRVLIVDDNQDAATSLARVLELAGHQTRIAFDGFQGLEAAEAFLPDVVILDIGLPRLNGYETCRRMKARPWGSGAVFIALTGWGQDEDKRKSTEAGFGFHLVKPVEPVELDNLLGAMLTGNPPAPA